MNDTNDNHDDSNDVGRSFFGDLVRDTGVQHAAAGVAVATAIAVVRNVLFSKGR